MDTVIGLISALCLFVGSFLCLTGGLGVLRFPDFYTRMHAAGITDTLGTGLILIGLMLQNPGVLVVFKLIIILLMTLLISPTASHALAKAAIRNDLVPVLGKNDNKEGDEPSNP